MGGCVARDGRRCSDPDVPAVWDALRIGRERETARPMFTVGEVDTGIGMGDGEG